MTTPTPFPARALWAYLNAPRLSWVEFTLIVLLGSLLREAVAWAL